MASTNIPPEVWLQIIRDATFVPPCDLSDYDPLPPSGSCRLLSGKLIVLIRKALSTKYAISLVCRLWSTLVVEFLYDFILVRDAVHIPHLVDQLSHAGTHIPLRVQRIDFVCAVMARDIHYKGVSYDAKQLAWTAAKLICLCPRLQALSFPASLWGRGDTKASKSYSRLLETVLMKVKDSLECLEWRSRRGVDSAIILSRLILPRLKLLLFSSETNYPCASSIKDPHSDDILTDKAEENDDEDYPEYLTDRPTTMIWAYSPFHTVNEEYHWKWAPGYEYPPVSERLSSLRHFTVTPGSFWLDQWSALPQVDTITFQKGSFRFVGNEGCTLPSTVHTIILHVQDLPMTPSRFPHIKRVGLTGTDTIAPEEYDYALNLFVGENGSGYDLFSILGMIRFVDTSLSGILRKRGLQLKLWERRCRSKGIRLEDETGKLITSNCL